MNRLDSEEKGILKAFNAGEFKQIQGIYQELSRHKVIAEATFKKDTRINIRLSSKDLRALKARALKEGIPYQTLVSSVLHKFVDGQLVEKPVDHLS